MNTEIVVALSSGIAAILSGALSALSGHGSILDTVLEFIRDFASSRAEPRKVDGLTVRLQQAREALSRQKALATTHHIASGLLTFSQFVVGGLLASSFLQETLSKQMVGGLGLLVLLSSLIRQHYRPEIQFIGARQRAAQLKALIRKVEDYRFSNDEGSPGGLPDHEIRALLSYGLSEIDESELHDLLTITRPEPSQPPTKRVKKNLPDAPPEI